MLNINNVSDYQCLAFMMQHMTTSAKMLFARKSKCCWRELYQRWGLQYIMWPHRLLLANMDMAKFM